MHRKNILVLINGKAGVGKDTFVRYCQDYLRQKGIVSHNLHRSDLPKKALKSMGWDGTKDESSRAMLKHMVEFAEAKNILDKYLEDHFLEFIDKEGDTSNIKGLTNVVFWHVRQPESMYRLIDKYLDSEHVTPISLLIMRDTENLEPDDWWDINGAEYMLKAKIEEGLEYSIKAAETFIDFILSDEYDVKRTGGYNG